MINFNTIKAALGNGEFFLEYLPTVAIERNRCIGAEALIRWRRQSEVVLPESFIPIVENTPLSGVITYWVIDTVAQELGDWLRANDGIQLSINVPPEVLGRGGLEYAARKSGLMDVANKLVLEVTERGIPDKLGLDALNLAGGTGVRIALDDFGMDDANLVLLSRIKVDIVKIHKSFAEQMLDKNWSTTKIHGLSALVRTTNLDVIVEGIETPAQVEILREAGIKFAQGWYFSPSISAKAFEAYFYAHQ